MSEAIRHHAKCGDHALQDDCTVARLFKGDWLWHSGEGWYYVDDEYRDEGSVGAFDTADAAVEHAHASQYCVNLNGHALASGRTAEEGGVMWPNQFLESVESKSMDNEADRAALMEALIENLPLKHIADVMARTIALKVREHTGQLDLPESIGIELWIVTLARDAANNAVQLLPAILAGDL